MLFLIWSLVFSVTTAGINGEAKGFDAFQSPHSFSETIRNYLSDATTRISDRCSNELHEYVEGVLTGKMWALKMFDAFGKIPPGILSGNAGQFGDFDQCIDSEGTTNIGPIFGQYCIGYILSIVSMEEINEHPINNTAVLTSSRLGPLTRPFTFGVCMPNACTPQEIQELLIYVGIVYRIFREECQSKFTEPEYDTAQIVTLTFIAIILSLMVICTVYDVIMHYKEKKERNLLLTSFSVFSNMKKLVATNYSPNQLTCLHGIRMLSLMWIMLGHRYAAYRHFSLTNNDDLVKWIHHNSSMFLLGAHVVVDTFLLLSGLVLTYVYMGAVAKGVKLNIPIFYLHRYLRLTPALAAEILILTNLIQFLGNGPLWPLAVDTVERPCLEYWWSSILFVQNYVNPTNLCLLHTHYLSVDTQLYLLSPILLIPLRKKPKVTMYAAVVLIIFSIICPFLIAWFYELRPAAWINGFLVEPQDYGKYFYLATHARAASWLIGFIAGYIIYQTKQYGIKKLTSIAYFPIINIMLWIVSLAVLYVCVFSWHELIMGEYDRLGNSLEIALVRPAWSVAICWIIFSCVHGYGGPVNWFLSLPICQVMSKLSYSMYLIHAIPLVITSYRSREAKRFDHIDIIQQYWGDVVSSFLLAVIWVLAFESPIVILEKVLLGGGGRKRKNSAKPKQDPEPNKLKENGHNEDA